LKVNDSTLLYARLGYEQAKLTGKSSISVLTTVATTSKSNWQGGFQYGLGLETAVYPNLSLRGEYNHTSFNSFTNGSGTSFNPSVNEYEMGLSYHFA
jgi:opacity protein-like surface antigen